MSHRNGKPKPHASKRTWMRWNARKSPIRPTETKTINDVIPITESSDGGGFQSMTAEL